MISDDQLNIFKILQNIQNNWIYQLKSMYQAKMKPQSNLTPSNLSASLNREIKSLEQEIQLTIYNYENILQTEKQNSNDRSSFLLDMLYSLRVRQGEELEHLSHELKSVEGQTEDAEHMEKQMANIGEGLDQIVQESKKLKKINEELQKSLEEQVQRQKQLDLDIFSSQKQLEQSRLKIDEWELTKIKWNHHKKEIFQIIQDAEEIGKIYYNTDDDIRGSKAKMKTLEQKYLERQ